VLWRAGSRAASAAYLDAAAGCAVRFPAPLGESPSPVLGPPSRTSPRRPKRLGQEGPMDKMAILALAARGKMSVTVAPAMDISAGPAGVERTSR
jgi:hypothetical protein